ncbi:hypothetical protein INR49_026839 [Caranx melampygus]|nr:hypothetical protein INR49_026839 [Caranx melampygus]
MKKHSFALLCSRYARHYYCCFAAASLRRRGFNNIRLPCYHQRQLPKKRGMEKPDPVMAGENLEKLLKGVKGMRI